MARSINCREAMKVRQEHSAGVVLFKEMNGTREYLILHYPNGHFDLPKGHIEGDETEIEAAVRELEEETCIDEVEIIEGYREMINYEFRHAGHLIQKDVVFFLGRTPKEEVTISHEHQDFMWMPYEQAHKKLTFDNAKALLEKAEQHLNKKTS